MDALRVILETDRRQSNRAVKHLSSNLHIKFPQQFSTPCQPVSLDSYSCKLDVTPCQGFGTRLVSTLHTSPAIVPQVPSFIGTGYSTHRSRPRPGTEEIGIPYSVIIRAGLAGLRQWIFWSRQWIFRTYYVTYNIPTLRYVRTYVTVNCRVTYSRQRYGTPYYGRPSYLLCTSTCNLLPCLRYVDYQYQTRLFALAC